MRKNLQQISEKFPAFLLLLPAFYYLNVAVNVYSPGMRNLLFSQFAIHFSAGLLVSAVFFIFWKDYRKAVMFSFILLCFYFFFSPFVDLIKQVFGQNSFVTKYTFLLPFFALLLIYLGYRIYKTGKQFKRLFFFFNLLFLVLCIFEVARLSSTKYGSYSKDKVVSQFKDYNKKDLPDLYLIIADEYAGQMQLSAKLGFDNSQFLGELRSRGFYVAAQPKTNYNQTAYSMASLFAMDYLDLSNSQTTVISDYMLARDVMENSSAVKFFIKQGYCINNFSFFDIPAKKREIYQSYFPDRAEVVNYNTFLYRLKREVGYHFRKVPKINGEEVEYNLNIIVDSLLKNSLVKKKTGPDFYYLHYLMPHHPYFFDSSGNKTQKIVLGKMPDSLRQAHYLSYLKYTNKKLLNLVDEILRGAESPPVIILASDHGYKQFVNKIEDKYYFSNLFTVYFPNGDYSKLHDSISTVNVFRTILNAQFEQRLPLLVDSTIYVPE